MALFPRASDPQKKTQRDLDAARASRNSLIERRKIAETSAAEHRDKARKLARDGADDQTLSAAELDMRREQDRTATFTGAISDVEATIADLEREIAQIIDQRCRNETVAAVTALADKWVAVAAAFDLAAGQLADIARESAVIVLDGYPLQVFMQAVKEQVPPAIALITNGLRHHAKAVQAGTAPASLPKPQAEPAQLTVVEPPPEVRRMFAMRSIKWKDGEGRQRHGLQYEDVDLPPSAAKRGSRCGAVVPITDPRRKQLLGARGGMHPDPNAPDLLDLDDEEATRSPHIDPVMASDPVRTANFAVLDRSKEARKVQVAVPRL